LTEHLGVRNLVSRCYDVVGVAKSGQNIQDLREKINRHYKGGRGKVQLPVVYYEKELKCDFNRNLNKALQYKE
jgi:hypothetical protein